MRKFDHDKHLKPPYSLGNAVNRMYQAMFFDKSPIRMEWNDVEITMRKIK